jgi:hypothetical protein
MFRDRLDVTWSFGVVTQRLAQLLESRAKALVEIDEGVGRPQLAAEFFAADHFSSALEQHEKKLRGLLLKPDTQALLAQLAGSGVHLKDTETEDSR